MFGSHRQDQGRPTQRQASPVAVYVESRLARNESLHERIADAVAPCTGLLLNDRSSRVPAVDAVFALYPDMEALDALAEAVRAQRARRDDGLPVLVVGLSPDMLTAFGAWLAAAARDDAVHGLRLIVDRDPNVIISRLEAYLEPVHETNIIAMPASTEVETGEYQYFFCLSPELRGLLAYITELAENNIERLYLLGGAGAGKTSLAYYYYLCRQRGNFVTVNFAAEANDDKAAMKSLLCGHVAGAFGGEGSRTGAFAHARDGVCFLDESHGVSGSVMAVLMEALDARQYLPYGASAKRPLECALVFASNRPWESLVAGVNLDEHARLAAQVVQLPALTVRREDLIAVLAVTLDRMRDRSTTWQAPAGLTHAAWQAVCACGWRGNTRALIRVIETAYVAAATRRAPLIERDMVDEAIVLWEPPPHAGEPMSPGSAPGF